MQIRFGDCVIDTETRQVLRKGDEVVLSPKAYRLLILLVEARPKALAKDALCRALWPDTFVVEANLSNLIGEIRAALGDSAQQPRFIRTLHGYGYAFSAEAEVTTGSGDGTRGQGLSHQARRPGASDSRAAKRRRARV